MQIPRVRGRQAHSGHLNREDQAWKEDTVSACICLPGKHWGKEIEIAIDHYDCAYCGATVRIKENGFARCIECGTIFNDGKPFAENRKIDPMRGMHRLFKAIA